MQSLGQLIDKLSNQKRWPGSKKAITIIRQYPLIVGEKINRNTSLKWIKNGVACINCRNSMWRFALHSMEEELIEKMNTMIGEPFVKRLLLRTGNVAQVKTPEIADASIKKEDAQWINQLVENAPDDIKHSFEKFLCAYKKGRVRKNVK